MMWLRVNTTNIHQTSVSRRDSLILNATYNRLLPPLSQSYEVEHYPESYTTMYRKGGIKCSQEY